MKSQTKTILIIAFAVIAMVAFSPIPGLAAKKPNILVIWGDDIGITNISAYSRGLMGYKTPNIDRIANEGSLSNRWGPPLTAPRSGPR
jgi:hypothetical protein